MIKEYTRMLRRPDEISYRALILGMFRYRPDPVKADYYAQQRARRE